ncbi:D-alanine--D-alanine ligase [Acidiferrimicrobium sp. IK]|uniref:D-alanine--D-alanine ligase family protein n=1 Tax=Acidiferrimicrobium sp. IK TaxID=2871700 RepID=UPI0021CB149A|nr:D-alanine--D-alanine ligase family protein [Acidiferrimicrobium sp. IK]MCU4184158.1 D-alanine--D-alanine ligase [Acidiferrimicrobium sp. IK]
MVDAVPRPRPGGRIRLVVLYGGRSAEHEVSCVSARHVLAACDPDRYQIEVIGIGTDGRWVDATPLLAVLPDDAAALPEPDVLLAGSWPLPSLPPPGSWPADAAQQRIPATLEPVGALQADGAHTTVVWPVLHGPMGEDGTVQGLCEVAGVAYVGAGVAGSAAAMDKALAKTAFAGAGLPQARWLGVAAAGLADHDRDAVTGLVKQVEADLGWPVYVKPANMGSTIGVSRAADPGELVAALDLAARYDDYLVVEEEIRGRELEIGVLGLDPLLTSTVGEIKPSHDFYDFDDKYTSGTADLLVPAPIPEDVADEMALLAVAACRALRVDAMARVDFFYDVDGRLLLNEINTLPGFTPISMYPRLWAASGVPYPHLVDQLVDLAIRRHQRRSTRQTSR